MLRTKRFIGTLVSAFGTLSVGLLLTSAGCSASSKGAGATTPPLANPATTADSLAAGFIDPPTSAHPQTWWHWMNGNITREGITADLEAMHRIGISEANIITVYESIPAGPVPVMSPGFFDMVDFAANEAQRLGMTLCMDNCPGWSSSGGPWVTADKSMQFVTASATNVTGPQTFSAKLPQPPTKKDFYGDIAVYAFPTLADEAPIDLPGAPPTLHSFPQMDVNSLWAHGMAKTVNMPVSQGGVPSYVELDFAQPVAARDLVLRVASFRGVSGHVLGSDDRKKFHPLAAFTVERDSSAPVVIELSNHPLPTSALRVVFEKPGAAYVTTVPLQSIELANRFTIPDLMKKAVFQTGNVPPSEVENDAKRQADPTNIIHREQMVDLTSSMKPDGTLNWNVPAGKWTILRMGYTTTGVTNHPAPPEATGLECDKLSTDGLDASWNGMMKPIIDRLGSRAGKVLVDCLIDSYETGGQNWTPKMKEEFIKRRGYDPTPYLPILTNRVIDSPAVTERFLWDLRRTVSDLFADNYFTYFTTLCHKYGLKSMIEPYTGPFESLQCAATNDYPMCEFWAGTNGEPDDKMASSAGHIYGQNIIAAESFTGQPDHGGWQDDPYSLKYLGDLMFTQGVNRYVFHRYTHQPWMHRYPGMTMGQWGINFERTNTWFEYAKPWIDYISRCQYMLQQGRPVADVAYFCGESVPVVSRIGDPAMPVGFDFDEVNTEVLMKAHVVNGRITLSSGASYAVVVLPASDPLLTPQLLQKLHDLVADGGTILGPRPAHSPSLQDYPGCDQVVISLASEMWGDIDGQKVTEHKLGDGKVVFGEKLEQVLSEAGLKPDIEPADEQGQRTIKFIHRSIDGGEIYFLADHSSQAIHVDCAFRVSGKVPELWHPDTGELAPAASYQVKSGRVIVPLDFDPTGSVFIVFRQADSTADHVVTPPGEFTVADAALPVDGVWQINFQPDRGAPATVAMDHLISWTDSADSGVKYFSGTATYTKDIDIPAAAVGTGKKLVLDLGTVRHLAQIKLNGTDLGILWKPPFKVDITRAAHAGTNQLEIAVTNLWRNRLIGDEQLPEDAQWTGPHLTAWPQWLLDGKPSPTGRITFTTWQHVKKTSPLDPSGLIGPVKLEAENWVEKN